MTSRMVPDADGSGGRHAESCGCGTLPTVGESIGSLEVLAVVKTTTLPGVKSFVAGDPVPCVNIQIEMRGSVGLGAPVTVVILGGATT